MNNYIGTCRVSIDEEDCDLVFSKYTDDGLHILLIDVDGDMMRSFSPFKNKGQEDYCKIIKKENIDMDKVLKFIFNYGN